MAPLPGGPNILDTSVVFSIEDTLTLWTTCRKALANTEMEPNRSAGLFARACKRTTSTFVDRRGLNVLGGCGWTLKCWYIIWTEPPWKGGRPVSNSYAMTAKAYWSVAATG